MRWVIAVVVWIVTGAVLAVVCFFAVLILAGPHSSMLPSALQPAVVIAGYLVVVVTPILLARHRWRPCEPLIRFHGDHRNATTRAASS